MTRNIPQSSIRISGNLRIIVWEEVSIEDENEPQWDVPIVSLKTSKSAIYEIRNLKTGNYYIGQTRNIDKRLNRHLNDLRKGIHKNPKLQKDWNDLGENCFGFFVVIYCRPAELSFYENILIKALTPRYNIKSAPQKEITFGCDPEDDRPVFEEHGHVHPDREIKGLSLTDKFWLIQSLDNSVQLTKEKEE